MNGKLVGSANLASGRFAIIETQIGDGSLGFSLVPWQPVLDQRIGQHVTGATRGVRLREGSSRLSQFTPSLPTRLSPFHVP